MPLILNDFVIRARVDARALSIPGRFLRQSARISK